MDKSSIFKISMLEEWLNIGSLFIKDESGNQYGTWKDRRSSVIIEEARLRGINKICLITAGNAGTSVAHFGRRYGIQTVAIIDKRLANRVKHELRSICAAVIEEDLGHEIFTSQKLVALAEEEIGGGVWDVTNGFHKAYQEIVQEIQHLKPTYLICPVGSGEGFVGLYEGLLKARISTKLIGVTPKSDRSIADKLPTKWSPYREQMESIIASGHSIIELSEEEIIQAFDVANKIVECEPSSAVVFGGLTKTKWGQEDIVVIINSGVYRAQ